MTIQIELNGEIIEFPDDATAEEILKVTGPVKLAPGEIERLAENSPRGDPADACRGSPRGDSPAEPPGGRATRWPTTVQPYEDDAAPEYEKNLSPTVRELLRRSRLPSSRAVERSEDVFKDNWHRSWSKRILWP
jgi:hypothetical protein